MERRQELIDPVLEEEKVLRHILLKHINVGLLCVQESADDRPSMSDIMSMLGIVGNESVCLPSPKQPAFSNLRSGVEPHIAQNIPEICSLNGVHFQMIKNLINIICFKFRILCCTVLDEFIEIDN